MTASAKKVAATLEEAVASECGGDGLDRAWDGRDSHVHFVGDAMRGHARDHHARLEDDIITVIPGFDYETCAWAVDRAQAQLRRVLDENGFPCFVAIYPDAERE